MYIYQSQYGVAAGDHSMHPQFQVKNGKIFPTLYNKSAAGRNLSMPWYEMRQNHVYQTEFHPDGHSALPVYEVRGNELHNTIHHPEGLKSQATFRIRPT